MLGKMKKLLYKEDGAVQTVEATFVFPIMFIILFFLIYLGNAHYIKAQIESVVETRAIEGAAYCADPILQSLKESGEVPSLSDKDFHIEPYRYLIGGMKDVEKAIGELVESDISGNTVSFFGNMKPELKTAKDSIAQFNNYFIYSTFSVEVQYEIKFPIKFLGAEAPPVLTISSRAVIPVDDTAEFIRNTDMVIDLFEDTKMGKGISDAFGKVNDLIGAFTKKGEEKKK